MPARLEPILTTIVDLGLSTREELDGHQAVWQGQLPDGLSPDEDPQSFLRYLAAAGVITASQQSALLRIAAPQPRAEGDPVPGRTFGNWIAGEKIGEGATARVYRAIPLGDAPQDSVIKVFLAPKDPGAQRRIQREGQLMASLDHPNIVKVYESGETDGFHYLVLEYVDGPTLGQVVERRRSFPWEQASRAVRQIASALTAVHALGVVHRDVKPHNILMTRGGTLKLADFGIAKALQGGDTATRAGEILGSPAYIAPEQWGDHAVDPRADLFAVGVIYYLLLTGVTPFRARTAAEYAYRIQHARYDPVQNTVPEVPLPVRALVDQLLERDRNVRTPSAEILANELTAILRRQPPNLPRIASRNGWFPLVGLDRYVIGHAPECAIPIEAQGIGAHHAYLVRTASGFALSSPEPELVTQVNNQRVIGEVILKDGDHLLVGEAPPMIFNAGNLLRERRIDLAQTNEFQVADLLRLLGDDSQTGPTELPGMLVAALEDVGHPLALLCCLEALDPYSAASALETSWRRLLEAGVAPDVARQAAQRARDLWRQRTDWLAERLFQTTHENLGTDLEAWLGWWFDRRKDYTSQVAPPTLSTHATLLAESADGRREFELADQHEWTVGRSLQSHISLADPSLSRHHMRIYRMVHRYAFRDLGSRMGVRQNGQRRDFGLLHPKLPLTLGAAKLSLLPEPLQPTPPELPVSVDRATFSALLELRSPSTLRALIGLLDSDTCRRQSMAAAHTESIELSWEVVLDPFLDTYRLLALECLPLASKVNHGQDPQAWRSWFQANRDQLPRQVIPAGWHL